jgi:hypothetical protein
VGSTKFQTAVVAVLHTLLVIISFVSDTADHTTAISSTLRMD